MPAAMAATQRPGRRTASRCTPETDRCTHVFEVAGYSKLKGLAVGKYIESAAFGVGGRDWCIRYYPNGDGEENEGHDSIYLMLISKATDEVLAICDFRVLNQTTELSEVVFSMDPSVFNDADVEDSLGWGTGKFVEKCELEGPPYMKDDCLVIECDVTVIMGMPVSESQAMCEIQVPPSDLSVNLGKLLDAAKGADETFKVKGEVFHVHKVVLAARSPVFEAEFYGPVGEDNKPHIRIKGMQPSVFKALLAFIYIDSLPAMDDLTLEETEEIVKHLLVAADRYAMERMKLICESMLCKRLNVQNVATTLALADRHNATQLKDACIAFINSSNRVVDVWFQAKVVPSLKEHAMLPLWKNWRNQPSLARVRTLSSSIV